MPHIHEQYDFVVSLLIVYKGKVLLVNHPRYDKWLSPGGHVELDEDPEQTIYREAQEETGLEIELLTEKPGIDSPGTKFLPTPNYFDVHDANPPHKHIGLVYFARAKSDAATLSDEHKEMRWFSSDELRDEKYSLDPALQFYAKEAIEKEGK